jgi:REP element-mobilizing transposase RayT
MLPFRPGRGGRRPGAGRKPEGDKAGVPHRPRSKVPSGCPSHVTVRLCAGLPRLRNRATDKVLRRCFRAANERSGFRLVHYSIQGNHLHLLVEAAGRQALARGMQGLSIRIAKALNRLWSRRGTVFADRFHDRVLRTPREIRNALAYVFHNARRHGLKILHGLDRYCSGWWFDGWKDTFTARNLPARPVAAPRGWLLRSGWRRHGLIRLDEAPG